MLYFNKKGGKVVCMYKVKEMEITVEVVTGLHIGGTVSFRDVGATDNIVVRTWYPHSKRKEDKRKEIRKEEIPELEPEDKWIFSVLQNLA